MYKAKKDIDSMYNTSQPLTDAQNMALTYAERMNESNAVITALSKVGQSLWGVVSGSDKFPNVLKTEERQQLEQAQRNFVNSVLRRESGAVISPSEFDNASKQYFPQPGDSDVVLKQKEENRKTALNGMYRSAQSSNLINNTGGEWDW
jgi:hypothetical protein